MNVEKIYPNLSLNSIIYLILLNIFVLTCPNGVYTFNYKPRNNLEVVMKKLFFFISLFVFFFPAVIFSEEIPEWVYKQAQKEGRMWLFSGSVHDISLMNIGVPLARAAALSNMATTIGVHVNSQASQLIEGSEMDGYVENISIFQGYEIDKVAAYGIRTKEMHVERFHDPHSGRQKFNIHILLEVSDTDLQKAKSDFSRQAMIKN